MTSSPTDGPPTTLHLSFVPSQDALFSALRDIDISVPPPGKQRTKHHTERWTICRLLSTLAAEGRLSYPLSVWKRESPDFILEEPSGDIGVEVTEATSSGYAKFRAIAEQEFDEYLIDGGHFRPESPALTTKQMRQLLETGRLTSPGWQGEAPELEWALFVVDAVRRKHAKLRGENFHKFTRNWLSIYANLPLPNVDLDRAVEYLGPAMTGFWDGEPSFCSIFIEDGNQIVCLSRADSVRLPLNDLWSGAEPVMALRPEAF